MSQAFESLKALTSDIVRIDVPVPACLNHCINQEVFYCKVCGEVFDNIHRYISHGIQHRSTSKTCGWCGGSWPTYAALCIHQLVWDGSEENSKENNGGQESGNSLLQCPLKCGTEPATVTTLQTHLTVFHGASQNQIQVIDKDGRQELKVSANTYDRGESCPKCSTDIYKKVSIVYHMAFDCLKRSPAVRHRTDQFLTSPVYSDTPLLPLRMEIQALVNHLRDLLSDTEYNQSFNELGEKADEKYEKLPPGFTKQYLSWLPTGYTLKVLESERNNFTLMFYLWCQVVDKLSGPSELKDVTAKLEGDLTGMLNSGIVPRWPPLQFDQAMLDTPDQDILNSLESQLGWVK